VAFLIQVLISMSDSPWKASNSFTDLQKMLWKMWCILHPPVNEAVFCEKFLPSIASQKFRVNLLNKCSSIAPHWPC